MRVLLDTNAFLWFVEGSDRLSPSARQVIEDTSNEAFLSIASIWEMAIKVGLGRLRLGLPFGEFIESRIALTRVAPLENRHETHLRAGRSALDSSRPV